MRRERDEQKITYVTERVGKGFVLKTSSKEIGKGVVIEGIVDKEKVIKGLVLGQMVVVLSNTKDLYLYSINLY